MPHEAQERYSSLVLAKMRSENILKDGIIFNNDYEGDPVAGSVKVPVRDGEVKVGDYAAPAATFPKAPPFTALSSSTARSTSTSLSTATTLLPFPTTLSPIASTARVTQWQPPSTATELPRLSRRVRA